MKNYIWPEITKDTPIEEVKRIHQQIWDYVIEYGNKPDDTIYKYLCCCSACEYANLRECRSRMTIESDDFGNAYKVHNFCYECPIEWPNNQRCLSRDSLFFKWTRAKGDEKIELAKQIRDLPWKFEMEGHDET